MERTLKAEVMKRKVYRRFSLFPWPTSTWAEKTRAPMKFRKLSVYGQKVFARRQLCVLFGNLRARQLGALFRTKKHTSLSSQQENFLRACEARVGTALLRTNCFASFSHIRSFLRQGKIFLNDRKLVSSGYLCQPGDVLRFPPELLQTKWKATAFLGRPPLHLEIDYALGVAIVLGQPHCIELPSPLYVS